MYQQVTKWGNSQGIRLPKSLLDGLEADIYSYVELIQVQEAIIIRKAPIADKPKLTHKTIQERFKDYDGGFYQQKELDWGVDVGTEVF
jgi:antitoxin MazE